MDLKRMVRQLALFGALMGAIGLAPYPSWAQSTPSAPATPAPAPSPPASPPTPAPASPSTPAPAETPGAPGQAPSTEDRTPPDTSISQIIQVQPRPVIELSGQATWDDGFGTINDAFTKLNETLGKLNLRSSGNATAVFTQTDDAGFKFTAEVPVEKVPEGKPDMPANVSFGMSPGGKAMRFQHRSAYDDINSTYDAITAYLDEKGLDATNNVFAEEYLNRVKSADDPSLEVDIIVFLK